MITRPHDHLPCRLVAMGQRPLVFGGPVSAVTVGLAPWGTSSRGRSPWLRLSLHPRKEICSPPLTDSGGGKFQGADPGRRSGNLTNLSLAPPLRAQRREASDFGTRNPVMNLGEDATGPRGLPGDERQSGSCTQNMVSR